MRIALGSDHAGFQLKETIRKWLEGKGHDVVDKGAYDEGSCDYPDFGRAVGVEVTGGDADRGIVVCGSGIGISIAANKVRGVRAALCSDIYSARMSREHNDANVLALGQRVIGAALAVEIADVWLNTAFEGGRHQGRLDKITRIEAEG